MPTASPSHDGVKWAVFPEFGARAPCGFQKIANATPHGGCYGASKAVSRLTDGCAWNAVPAFANCGRAVGPVRACYVPKASRCSHSIAASDVSDELISYYHERKTGEQVRSLRGSQPTIPPSPVFPSYFAGRAGVAVAPGSTPRRSQLFLS